MGQPINQAMVLVRALRRGRMLIRLLALGPMPRQPQRSGRAPHSGTKSEGEEHVCVQERYIHAHLAQEWRFERPWRKTLKHSTAMKSHGSYMNHMTSHLNKRFP